MPTGYTAPLYEGKDITLEQFILRCSRAMGAAIMQRDDSLDVEIELRVPSDYERDNVGKAQRELAAAESLTLADWGVLEREDREQANAALAKSIADRTEKRGRYEAMLVGVRGWIPPTAEHNGLKDFMIQQLEESIQFDCSVSERETGTPRRTAEEYRAQRLERLRRDLDWASERWAEEQARVQSQNAWVIALRESLGIPA